MKTDTHTITLTYKEGDPAGPWFMSTKLTQPPEGKGHYTALKVAKGDDAVFNFKIATKDIAFDRTKPIEIRAADSKHAGDPKQFVPKLVKPDSLEVTNPNTDSDATDYYYQLNFVGKPPLDPIIQNGCCKGGGGGFISKLTSAEAIAVMILAAVVVALVAMRRRRST